MLVSCEVLASLLKPVPYPATSRLSATQGYEVNFTGDSSILMGIRKKDCVLS